MPEKKNVTINGTTYEFANLSQKAKDQIKNMNAVDMHIARLKQELAIASTARVTYANLLQSELPQVVNA